MRKTAVFALLIALLLPLSAISQSFYAIRKDRSLILVAGVGNSSYFGELKNPNDYLDPKASASLGLQYYFSDRISVRSELSYISLRGDDASSDDESRRRRNLSFTSGNIEFNAVGMVNLFPQSLRFYQRPTVNFYGFAGFGLLYMNPKAELDGEKYALQPLQTEGVKYSRLQPVIPYGLGVRLKVNPFFNFSIETGWRLMFTDYLDDVSTVHPDKSGWTDPVRIALSDRRTEGNPSLGPYEAGTKRGNPEKNDSYFTLSAKIEFYLPHNFIIGNPNRKLYNKKRKAYYRR